MKLTDQLQSIIQLLQSIDHRLSVQPRQNASQGQNQQQQRKRVEIVAKITSSPNAYKSGTGDFYDAKTDKGETISLGVSRQKMAGQFFALNQIVHCFADDAGTNNRGVPMFFLSEQIFDQAPTKQPELPSQPATTAPDQSMNGDLPF